VAVNDFDEFCVDTVREINVVFEFRTDLFDFEIVNVIHIYDRMWISHGNTCDTVSSTIYIQRFVDDLFLAGNDRNLVCCQNRGSHIYFNEGNFAVIPKCQIQILDTAFGCNRDAGLVDDAVIISILGNTSDSISAHSTLRAVEIVHIHLTVCHVRRFDQDQTI